MIIAPDYYKEFKCVAEKCRHNCCIGWEIDVDPVTLCKYEKISGELGEKLRRNIVVEGGVASFKTGEDDRCPFLNARGLCEIIISQGEGALCQVCADHPRWRNFFSDHTEIGVGASCEEAARLILSKNHKVGYEVIDDSEENAFQTTFERFVINSRAFVLDIMQNREQKIAERITKIREEFSLPNPADFSLRAEFLLNLERLDDQWDEVLLRAKQGKKSREIDVIFAEQIAVYFIMRHLGNAEDDFDFIDRQSFCLFATEFVISLYERTDFGIEELFRLFSSEIEYSDDNLFSCIEAAGEGRL